MIFSLVFETGDRSTPDEIEKFIRELIPTADEVRHFATNVAHTVAQVDKHIEKPLTWEHRVAFTVSR